MLARLGLFRVMIDHQRLVHTFVTNVRGPTVAMHLGGNRIDAITPLVATPGNVGISFAALSYAGELIITLIADPEIAPELDTFLALIATQFAALAAA